MFYSIKLASSDYFKERKYKEALKATYMGIDQDMLTSKFFFKKIILNIQREKLKFIEPGFENESSGCTAVSALITEDWRVLVANAGDSRAVLSAAGHAEPLSFDHKPTNPGEQYFILIQNFKSKNLLSDETKRIVTAGGFVNFGRVNGNID